MFQINTKPLQKTKTPANYPQLIFDRFNLENFNAGASEVHLIFDKPSQQPFLTLNNLDTPKETAHVIITPANFRASLRWGAFAPLCRILSPNGILTWCASNLDCRPPEFQYSISAFPSHQKQLYLNYASGSIAEGIGTFLKQGSYMVCPEQKLALAGCFSGSSQGECSARLVQATEVSQSLKQHHSINPMLKKLMLGYGGMPSKCYINLLSRH